MGLIATAVIPDEEEYILPISSFIFFERDFNSGGLMNIVSLYGNLFPSYTALVLACMIFLTLCFLIDSMIFRKIWIVSIVDSMGFSLYIKNDDGAARCITAFELETRESTNE